jgi:hypothetical protein
VTQDDNIHSKLLSAEVRPLFVGLRGCVLLCPLLVAQLCITLRTRTRGHDDHDLVRSFGHAVVPILGTDNGFRVLDAQNTTHHGLILTDSCENTSRSFVLFCRRMRSCPARGKMALKAPGIRPLKAPVVLDGFHMWSIQQMWRIVLLLDCNRPLLSQASPSPSCMLPHQLPRILRKDRPPWLDWFDADRRTLKKHQRV